MAKKIQWSHAAQNGIKNPSFIPTQEQADIFDEVRSGTGHITVVARAGTGKSSTAIESIKYIQHPKPGITFLCFNAHIQQELKSKLPENIFVYTTHALGLSAFKKKYGQPIIDDYKVNRIVNTLAKKWGFLSDVYKQKIIDLVGYCKKTMSLKESQIRFIASKNLIPIDKETDIDIKRVQKVLEMSILDTKTIDFNDMVFMPAFDKKIWLFPQDFIYVDECFEYNTNIITNEGVYKIGKLEEMFSSNKNMPLVKSFSEETKTFVYNKIKKVWKNGRKEIFQIVLNGKRKIKATRNHKFLTLEGWKRLDQLKIGDGIVSDGKSQPYHEIANEVQSDIIKGGLLGDGSRGILSPNINRFKFIHGRQQREYLYWKSSFFNAEVELIEENGYSKLPAYRFNTKGLYIKDDSLTLKNIISSMNLRILSIMWMDDGSLDYINYCSGRLYSLAKSEKFSNELSNKLNELYGIKSKVVAGKSSTTEKLYYWLEFNVENTTKLSSLIREYVHPSMDYKLLPKDRGLYDPNLWIEKEFSYGVGVVTSEYKFIKEDEVFDIEVEKDHNFLITSSSKYGKYRFGTVAHNCQDLNKAQHTLILKMLKKDKLTNTIKSRIFSFGDNYQSIMGFSGSDSESFNFFKNMENTKVLPLTYTFRCSKAVVTEANTIVSDIKAFDKAIDGIVRKNGSVLNEAEPGDFVLSRKSKPLIRLFFELFMRKKKAIIKGSDLGKRILETTKSFKDKDEMMDELNYKLLKYREELLAGGVNDVDSHYGYTDFKDLIGCIEMISKTIKTMADIKTRVKDIFGTMEEKSDYLVASDAIILSTVHKSKGLEADRVFIIKPQDLPLKQPLEWMEEQEKNLHYVAITRAKKELIYDYTWTDEKDEKKDK